MHSARAPDDHGQLHCVPREIKRNEENETIQWNTSHKSLKLQQQYQLDRELTEMCNQKQRTCIHYRLHRTDAAYCCSHHTFRGLHVCQLGTKVRPWRMVALIEMSFMGRFKKACIRWGWKLVPPGKYNRMICVWRRCGPMWNYFDHLL